MTDPVVVDAPYLSYNRLTTFESCPKKFDLSYNQHYPQEPQGALLGGSAIHQVIEEFEKQNIDWVTGPRPTDEDLGHRFEVVLVQMVDEAGGPDQVRWGGRKSGSYPNGEDLEWWRENGPAMLAWWSLLRQADELSGLVMRPTDVEFEVLFTLDDGTSIKGYVDALLIDPDGAPRLRDYKSGRVGGGDPLQLAIYAEALERTRGIAVDHGEFVYLRSAVAEKSVVGVDLNRYRPMVAEAFGELLPALKVAQDSNTWPAKRGTFCPGCSVRAGCWWGKTLDDA